MLAIAARAHDSFEITTTAHVRADALVLEITMARSTALAAIRGVREAPIFERAEFAVLQPQFIARAPALYAVTADGAPLTPRRVTVGLGVENDVEFRLEYPRSSTTTLRLEARYLAHLGAGFGDVLVVRQENGPVLGEKLLDANDRAFAVELPPGPRSPLRHVLGAVVAAVLVGGLCWWRRREIFARSRARPPGWPAREQAGRIQAVGPLLIVSACGVGFGLLPLTRERVQVVQVGPAGPVETPPRPVAVAHRTAHEVPPVSPVDPVSRDADQAEALQDLAGGEVGGLAARMETLSEAERGRLTSALFLVFARTPGEAVRLAHAFCRADPPGAADYGYALLATLAQVGDFSAALEFVRNEAMQPHESENPGKWTRAIFAAWARHAPDDAARAAAQLLHEGLRGEALAALAGQ